MKIKELLAQREEILAFKKSVPHHHTLSKSNSFKMENMDEDKGEIHLKIVANLANYMDKDGDVIMPGAFNKSIQERGEGSSIPFLYDHIHILEGRVGTTKRFKYEDVPGMGTALIHEAIAKKSYNEKVYSQYKFGDINQHSLGMRYIKVDLAVNDPNEEEYYKNWQAIYGGLLNKEKAMEQGFFFAVREAAIIENSATLWGINDKTPVLEYEQKSDKPKKIQSFEAKMFEKLLH